MGFMSCIKLSYPRKWPEATTNLKSRFTPKKPERIIQCPSLLLRSLHTSGSAWPDPALENPYGGKKGRLFVPLMTFDRAHQLVASGGLVYFGSSADHKVYCLDAATVEIRWVFHTEAQSVSRRRSPVAEPTWDPTMDGSTAWTPNRVS